MKKLLTAGVLVAVVAKLAGKRDSVKTAASDDKSTPTKGKKRKPRARRKTAKPQPAVAA